ncbi:MAG: transglutaminase-like cysteine peptidase [Myxococcota bacterium]
MPRIPARFAPFLSVTSDGGARLSVQELEQALPTAPAEEVTTLRNQALDVVADGSALEKLIGTTPATPSPGPISALRDHPATRDWLDGNVELTKTSPRELIQLVQRALMKIGAHHPDARNRPELLMLPWGADGSLGNATVAAINAALAIAGRTDLTVSAPTDLMSWEVAEVIDGLLATTPRILHPSLINVPPPSTPVVTPPPAPTQPDPVIWGRQMIPTSVTGLDGKWTNVLAKTDAEMPQWDTPSTLSPAARYLRNELEGIRNQSPAFQLQRVNSLVNGWLFASDASNYGVEDYWASPLEFMAKQRGDCEDYCMVKYAALKRLGFTEDQFKLLVVIEKSTGRAHAVLSVKMPDGEYILDNLNTSARKVEDVVDTAGQPRYHPLLAFARDGKWLFVPPA